MLSCHEIVISNYVYRLGIFNGNNYYFKLFSIHITEQQNRILKILNLFKY